MQNALITRWELTPEEKFWEFYKELIKYLKENMSSETNSNGITRWHCDFSHADQIDGRLDPKIDRFKYSGRFSKNLLSSHIS